MDQEVDLMGKYLLEFPPHPPPPPSLRTAVYSYTGCGLHNSLGCVCCSLELCDVEFCLHWVVV